MKRTDTIHAHLKLPEVHTLFVISGPSGSGKTSSIRQVMENEVISFTTRAMRVGEQEGVDYVYTTVDEVDRLEAIGELVERVTYDGNSYGISKGELYGKLQNEDAFVVVDYHGYEQIQALYPNCVSIFFAIDTEDAKNRMLERGDNPATMSHRLSTYETELANQVHYDYVLQNQYGKQAETVAQLKQIIEKHQTESVKKGA